MEFESDYKNIQLQYEGYLNTPVLWKNANVLNITQIQVNKVKTTSFLGKIPKKIRLGKRVEYFVSNELSNDNTIKILAENVQINKNKVTVGEIDRLITINNQPVHLEIIYKFYLYDKRNGPDEIDWWIGPNRKDNLRLKLQKLKEKQLPLLYNDSTQKYLQKLHLTAENIQQKVYFKAQLFVPYFNPQINFKNLNSECIAGYYLHYKELQKFEDCKFYVPVKANWLQQVHPNCNWLQFNAFFNIISENMQQNNAVLSWVKQPNGEIFKCFVIWWN